MTCERDRIQEKVNKKYVIKNCPCIVVDECNSFKDDEIFCKDCTDCAMKQIVELCKQYKKDYNTGNEAWLLANNITNLFEIEEVS